MKMSIAICNLRDNLPSSSRILDATFGEIAQNVCVFSMESFSRLL